MRIERGSDGAATVRYEDSELGVLYPDRGVAELPVLDREHDVLIEHGAAEPAELTADSAGVSHSIQGPSDITAALELFDRRYRVQGQLGLSPLTTGLAFLPLTGVLVVTSPTVQTRVIQHTGVKPLVLAGTTLGAIAMFLFTRLTPSSGYVTNVLPGLVVLGVGMGCIFAPAFSTATLGVEGREAGVASAMVNTSQQVGGSVGTSLLSTIFASALASYAGSHLHTTGLSNVGLANAAAVHGDTTAFWWSVGIFVLAFLVAVLILPGRAKPRVPTLRAALARLAIGNCHHVEATDGARQGLGAPTGAQAR